MKFSVHLAASAMLAALFYPVFGINSLLILVGGIFPDIDHYLHFVFIKKRFNPFECNRYYTGGGENKDHKEFEGALMIFHTVESLIGALVASFYSYLAFIFTIGLTLHYLLDAIFFKYVLKKFVLNYSILWWLAKKIQKA